jgi:hypothetical protein
MRGCSIDEEFWVLKDLTDSSDALWVIIGLFFSRQAIETSGSIFEVEMRISVLLVNAPALFDDLCDFGFAAGYSMIEAIRNEKLVLDWYNI